MPGADGRGLRQQVRYRRGHALDRPHGTGRPVRRTPIPKRGAPDDRQRSRAGQRLQRAGPRRDRAVPVGPAARARRLGAGERGDGQGLGRCDPAHSARAAPIVTGGRDLAQGDGITRHPCGSPETVRDRRVPIGPAIGGRVCSRYGIEAVAERSGPSTPVPSTAGGGAFSAGPSSTSLPSSGAYPSLAQGIGT